MKRIELANGKSFTLGSTIYQAGEEYIVKDDVARVLLSKKSPSGVRKFREVNEVVEAPVVPETTEKKTPAVDAPVKVPEPTITHKNPQTNDDANVTEKTLTKDMSAKDAIALIKSCDEIDNISLEGDKRSTVAAAYAARQNFETVTDAIEENGTETPEAGTAGTEENTTPANTGDGVQI